jgi:hypothetical protein
MNTNKPSAQGMKFFGRTLMVAFFLSMITSTGMVDSLLSYPSISNAVIFLARIIPAIGWIAERTNYVATAKLTIALQWVFVPFYFFFLCTAVQPWKIYAPKKEMSVPMRWKATLATIPGVVIMILFILGDWNVGYLPSFFQGTIWNPTIYFTTMPYLGWTGLALSSFISPLIEVLIYWLVPIFVLNLILPTFFPFLRRNIGAIKSL